MMNINGRNNKSEAEKASLNNHEFILEGLCCVNCGSKIEDRVGKINGVNKSNLNFMTKKLTVETDGSINTEKIQSEIKTIVSKIERDVKVIYHSEIKTENKNRSEEESGHEENESKEEIIRLVTGSVIFAIAIVFKFQALVEFILYVTSYILVGGEVVLRAMKNIKNGQVFDENFLMAIATIGAFSIGQFPEGVAVMLFYQIGELFQDIAVNQSRKSISELMDIRPDFANLKKGEDIIKVSPEEVKAGDVIIVKPGEKVPLDGKIKEGKSMVDTSALTGEALPRELEAGDTVLGGFINKNGLLTIEVTKEFAESAVAKILDLVQNASSKKAPTENFITKFARYYTPAVVFSALALAFLPPLFIKGAVFSEWIYRALIFLVVSCPCALVVSIPLGFFGGIGGASKNGILVKGGNYLEALNNVEIVVLDKTGTLTKGVFKVTDICEANSFSKKQLLGYAAFAECYSNHPISASILKAFGKDINRDEVKNYEEISGYGIKVLVRGKEVLAGNAKLMKKEGIIYHEIDSIGTVVHVAVDKAYAGHIIISDELKEDSQMAVKALREAGVKRIVMLTGDNKAAAEKIAQQLGIDEVYAELLPDEKVEKLEIIDKEKTSGGKLIFAGDGINDAPVLARADIGIAMGGVGSDAAIEAADVVIMNDELMKIPEAIKIAARTNNIVWQNIIFAIGVKIVIMILGAAGVATMWEAVFGDVGVALIAVLNAMRVLNVSNIKV